MLLPPTIIILGGENVFHDSYQSVIQDKFDILCKTNEPKIIIVGGSSNAFGINQDMLKQATGYEIVNLGLHAGFGCLFISELAKANINPGDIVLLGYEYDWINDTAFTEIGTDLIMSGIDEEIDMYRYIPINKYPTMIGYLYKFANVKSNYISEGGMYSRASFDKTSFQCIYPRTETLDYDFDKYVGIEISGDYISEKSIKYLKEYKQFIEQGGASVYFIAPPLHRNAIKNDILEFDKIKQLEEKYIGIEYISNPLEYILDGDYFCDSMYHCNDEGELLRTELLIEDLKTVGINRDDLLN